MTQTHSRDRTILLIVADGAPGGGTTVVSALARELAADGWNVHLITDTESHLARSFTGEAITTHEVSFFRSRFDRSLQAFVTAVHARIRPNIVHVHGARALFAARSTLAQQPTIYTVHGYHLLHRSLPERIVGTIVERIAIRHVSTIVFVSENDRSLGRKNRLVPERARQLVIHNGIDLTALTLGAFTERTPSEPITVAFLSRLSYPKDPFLALEVAQQLGDDARLVMIGGGELESEVRSRVAAAPALANTTVLGSVDHDAALTHLRNADVMLLCSRWEGLPVAPLEAMAVGVPVVASDLPSMHEVFGTADAGIVVSGRAPEAFASAIRSLVDNERRAEIRAAARQRVEAEFSWATAWAKHQALYSSLL